MNECDVNWKHDWRVLEMVTELESKTLVKGNGDPRRKWYVGIA